MSFLDRLLKVFLGDKSKKDINEILKIVQAVKSEEESLPVLSNDQLRAQTQELKLELQEATKEIRESIEGLKEKIDKATTIADKESLFGEVKNYEEKQWQEEEKFLNTILPKAFAIVRQTALRFKENETITVSATEFDRTLSGTKDYVQIDDENAVWYNSWDAAGKSITWDMVHYDVQLIGGVVLHQGKISEMKTGEGKTLVATLPLYLNALTGKGVHLVTVNDYLAKRDSAWMAPIFEFHGISVDCIDAHEPGSEERKKAYEADIIYGTNNEFGFDYLRDNMAVDASNLVQRKHNYAIVDEVDSVLIDDARTPLIISGPVAKGNRHEFHKFKPTVERLVSQQRKTLTETLAQAKQLIGKGDTKEGGKLLLRVHRGLPKSKQLIKFLSEEGMKQLLQKTESFYMQDNNKEMHKIDEELLFVNDEKNHSVELTDKGIELFSQDKDFFVLPDLGTEISEIENQNLSQDEVVKKKEELYRVFSKKSDRIHTVNQLLKAYTLFNKDIEYVVMDGRVKIVDEQTGRIMEGRRYSDGLHQAIEAKEHVKIEAATQTFATITLQNYFRIYNKLAGMTGTAATEAAEFWEIYKLDVVQIPMNKPLLRKDENDLIYKTNREKFNALIEQTVELSQNGQPVLIGTASVEVSELLSRMLKLRKIKHNVLNAKHHKQEADVVAEAGKKGMVTIATNMAGRGTDIKVSEEIKELGGLAIIGSERHDSRRVDNQLRGRSGRQGDPGSSVFYISLEDSLMRLFGSERIARVMDRLGHQEGEVLQHGMLSRSIQRAQKKVEQNNFGIRKRLLEYDDVMNFQRKIIYERRRHALMGERLKYDLLNMLLDSIESMVGNHVKNADYTAFELDFITHFHMKCPVDATEFASLTADDIGERCYRAILDQYKKVNTSRAQILIPLFQKAAEEKAFDEATELALPLTDGDNLFQFNVNLKKMIESEDRELEQTIEKTTTLHTIDEFWKDHLKKMDELRQSVQLVVHEQKDPLLVYKLEAYELFNEMLNQLSLKLWSLLMKLNLPGPVKGVQVQTQQHEAKKLPDEQNLDLSRSGYEGPVKTAKDVLQQPKQPAQPKINRNDRVTILNVSTAEEKELKYKQAQPLIESGQWVLKN